MPPAMEPCDAYCGVFLFYLVQGSLSLKTRAFPIISVTVPSLGQHGKEGSQEGSSRGPKGDESDEGQESMKVSNMKSYAMLLAG